MGEWERRADVPFGLWAPELTASRLLGIAEVARLVGVSPATIAAYLSRRRMPEPIMRLGRVPVWSRRSSGSGSQPGPDRADEASDSSPADTTSARTS